MKMDNIASGIEAEEEVDFKGVCCSCGNYFCGGGIVLRLYNPLFNVI